LRKKQAAAYQQAGQRDAHREHAQPRFKAETVSRSRLAAAARSMNAYASVSGRPF
jgi:hypothetical protein